MRNKAANRNRIRTQSKSRKVTLPCCPLPRKPLLVPREICGARDARWASESTGGATGLQEPVTTVASTSLVLNQTKNWPNWWSRSRSGSGYSHRHRLTFSPHSLSSSTGFHRDKRGFLSRQGKTPTIGLAISVSDRMGRKSAAKVISPSTTSCPVVRQSPWAGCGTVRKRWPPPHQSQRRGAKSLD